MKIFELKQTQHLSIPLDEAWSFFSNPRNLDEITPPFLKFKIKSSIDNSMYEGQIINYSIKILPGIFQNWVTEIKSVRKGEFFIDEQRFGPYKFWHHKHIFKPESNGVVMTDHIHYSLPFGIIGLLAHILFVKRRLKQIFDYRYNWLDKNFNK
ncbi:MAG: SRPBCC family protein [Melioribacteraceae bacterium]|nr:SRPBCC family protein [Melioribacteraceae bacterium]